MSNGYAAIGWTTSIGRYRGICEVNRGSGKQPAFGAYFRAGQLVNARLVRMARSTRGPVCNCGFSLKKSVRADRATSWPVGRRLAG
jgi:hypothetical protein